MELNKIEVVSVEPYLNGSTKFFLGNGTTTVLSKENLKEKVDRGELVGFEESSEPEATQEPEAPSKEDKPKEKPKPRKSKS